jgi:hypothetical protein
MSLPEFCSVGNGSQSARQRSCVNWHQIGPSASDAPCIGEGRRGAFRILLRIGVEAILGGQADPVNEFVESWI